MPAAIGVVARLALCVPLLAAIACGNPDYTYVKNSDAGVYVKMPRDWGSINPEEVHTRFSGDATTEAGKVARQHAWHAAFDAAREPSIQNVFGDAPAEPVVWVSVRDVPAQERAQLSVNALRDIRYSIREAATTEGAAELGFELLQDNELNPEKGLYGVRTVFNHRVEGESQTIDQTVLTNDRHSKIYYLLVRCSTKCYHERRDEISTVVDSFTVRG